MSESQREILGILNKYNFSKEDAERLAELLNELSPLDNEVLPYVS